MAQTKIVTLFLPIYLVAQDLDLDGVDDEVDECPNSSFSDIVEKNGCKSETLNREWSVNLLYGNSYFENTLSHFFQSDFKYKSVSTGIIFYKETINYLFSYEINTHNFLISTSAETNFKSEYSISSDVNYIYSDSLVIFFGYIYSSFEQSKLEYFTSKSHTFYNGISKSFGQSSFSASYSNSSPFEKDTQNLEFIATSYSLQISDWSFSISASKNIIDNSAFFYSSSIGFQY